MPVWTAEADDELRRLQAGGYSGGRIAALMGKTRNAVIGRLHRLKLPPMSQPAWFGSPKAVDTILTQMTRHRISNPRPRRPPPPRPAKPGPATARRSALTGAAIQHPGGPCTDDTRIHDIAPEAGGVLWIETPPGGCLWPMNEIKPIREHRRCGAHRVKSGLPGDPYCAEHSRMALKTPNLPTSKENRHGTQTRIDQQAQDQR